jgi:Transcription factor WhiB
MRRDGMHVQYRHEHKVRFTMADESWRQDAACRGRDTDLWFVAGVPSAALGFCARCPVTSECLGMALRAEAGSYDRFGVFGGLTAKQRAARPWP